MKVINGEFVKLGHIKPCFISAYQVNETIADMFMF
jgi:hypothetical protein